VEAQAVTQIVLSERDWQQQCLDYARLMGWLVYHTFNSQRSEPGYPDLTMVRERVVFAELKVGRGRVTHAQTRWLERLQRAGAEAYVWVGPTDWPLVQAALRRPPPRMRHQNDVQTGGKL
jgi:hypothetical protein